ncbi:MAG: type II toxin-antitoxin system MqsA family antitoxin [Chloroflexi bacterium]|nr:type II toxin-antitoxin system MqsA family antitoxin [Chloroflexota bacterium]
MICLICRQAEIVPGSTSIPFERGEFRLLVNHVPARICPVCGEAILEEMTAIRLLSLVEGTLQDGLMDEVRDFE